jgi:hypothetical protein
MLKPFVKSVTTTAYTLVLWETKANIKRPLYFLPMEANKAIIRGIIEASKFKEIQSSKVNEAKRGS